MRGLVLYGLLAVAACGRYGFDEGDEASPDAGVVLLKCGIAPKFAVGSPQLRDISAVATSSGFALFTADGDKELRGWSFDVTGGALAMGAQNVRVDADVTGAFGASAAGDAIVVGAIHGQMTTVGTTYHALDAQLAPRAAAVTSDGRVIGVDPLAKCGTSSDLASIRYEAGDVAVHGLAATGDDLGMRMLGVAAESPSELSIVPAGTGYAAAWIDTVASPNSTKLALLDENYAIVKGPVVVMNSAGENTIRPRIRWAPESNTYAVAWFEKNASGGDDVYAQVFDAQLVPKFAVMRVQANAVRPKLATDGTGFFIGFVDIAGNPQRMMIAHLALDGTLTIRAAASSGGSSMAFAMVERLGQPVLVYAEDNGAVDLWFDPLCP